MSSFVAHLTNASGMNRIAVDVEAPEHRLAVQAAEAFARYEPGGLHVVDVHERPHMLRVSADGEVFVSRYLDGEEPYPDDRARPQWRVQNPDWPSGDGPHLVPDDGP